MKPSVRSRGCIAELGGAFLLASASSPRAATSTATMTVQMTITATCTVNSATTLNFGTQGVLSTNVDQTSTIQVTCTNTTPYNIGLDPGTGTGATVATRKMTSGANTVNYTLYSNSTRTTVWGNTVGTDTVAATATARRRATRSTAAFHRKPRPRRA